MERLPLEILSHVLSFLKFEELIRVARVARTWRAAALVALRSKKGFVIGSCLGNKPFCDGIPRVGQLDVVSEHAIRLSLFQVRRRRRSHLKSRLSLLCPNVSVLCDDCCDTSLTRVLLRDFSASLVYLQLDSYAWKLSEDPRFPVLQYLKCHRLSQPESLDLERVFPVLRYLDCQALTAGQVASLPSGLRGLKVLDASGECLQQISHSRVRDSLQALHVITDRGTASVESFCFAKLEDVSVRGLEQLGCLFRSLKHSRHLSRLHVSARTCVSVRIEVLLSTFEALTNLTSLNLRFLVLSDPVSFWTRMVQVFAHRLQHLTFSTHFVTSDSLRLMTGFAVLKTLSFPFVYEQPFLFNNVPASIRSRRPFNAQDLLAFLRSPTASRATLEDVSIQMQSLGSDMQVIRDLETELSDMKRNQRLLSAEVREQFNRNSIYV